MINKINQIRDQSYSNFNVTVSFKSLEYFFFCERIVRSLKKEQLTAYLKASIMASSLTLNPAFQSLSFIIIVHIV